MKNKPFSLNELSALPDQELLTLLLECCRISEAERLSADIIARHGTLASAATDEVLAPDSVTSLLRLIPALSRNSSGAAPKKASLSDTSRVSSFFRKHLSGADSEQFIAAAADNSLNCSAVMPAVKGSPSSVILSCRKIAGFAIASGCDIIFIAHSHPNGTAAPSEEDIDATRSVVSALKPIGIQLADHIIIGREDSVSLRKLYGDELFQTPPPNGYRLTD